MATTEERLETIEKRLKEKQDGSGPSILGGCFFIGFAIMMNGCLGEGGTFSPIEMGGSSFSPYHVELSIDSSDRLKVQLVDRAGKDISLE